MFAGKEDIKKSNSGSLSLGKPFFQPRLTINQPNDVYEHEADAMTDKVMRMPVPLATDHLFLNRLFHLSYANARIAKEKRNKCNGKNGIEKQLPLQHTEDYINSLSGGKALDENERNFFEPRMGQDFSHVRLHTNSEANRSAKSINALAYTHGNHIVFESNQYQPNADSGKKLLAHELARVIQQKGKTTISHPNASIVQKQTPGSGQSSADSETLIRNWLEQHQFAPPENQPAEGERHVLMNGENMVLSRAVQLTASAVNQPAEIVRQVMTSLLLPSVGGNLLQSPIIGPNNLIPGIPSLRLTPTLTGGIDPAIGKMIDIETIDHWLDDHGFSPPEIRDPIGDTVVLDGQNTTIEEVANRAWAVAGGRVSFLSLREVIIHLRQRYVAARGGSTTQIVLGYTLIPRVLQAITPSDTLHTQHQFSFTITRAHHPGDSPGLESSFQGSLTMDESGEILNIQAGGQEAVVVPLLRGWIQISGLVQTMASANWNRSVTGSATISPAIQLAGGAQVLVTPNFRGGPLILLMDMYNLVCRYSVEFRFHLKVHSLVLLQDWCLIFHLTFNEINLA